MSGQSSPEIRQILERLERLEQANRALAEEVRALRAELSARDRSDEDAPPQQEEQLAIQEHRIEEQAQTKVESSQRFPIRLTGMALFNSFLNSKQSDGLQYPTIAPPPGYAGAGATFRQTLIGLDYRGPETFWGGKVHGSLFMDFLGGAGQSLNEALRLRTGSVEIAWKSRSLRAGLEKPIFNPRQPNSLAQVGVAPLTGAGNLWLWIPQVRFGQDFRFSEGSGVRAQIGVVQTQESTSYQSGEFLPELEPARPGVEGRFEFFSALGSGRRLEIAPGFHSSVTHVVHTSVPSKLFSLDWFANPCSKLELTGAFFAGRNVAHLGTGGIQQGFVVLGEQRVRPVHSRGGWAQLTWLPTDRLSFNLFSGQHDDRNADLDTGRIGKNWAYGVNLFYRLAPNVVLSLETSQVRTSYIGSGNRLNNHYDLALAYLF